MAIYCRASRNPSQRHWKILKRLVRYLNGTQNHGPWFGKEAEVLHTYADADYANDPTTHKSTSGIVHVLSKAPIQWTSKRQSAVALSTFETEYIAASMAAQQTIWLRTIIIELRMPTNGPTPLRINNQSAIRIALQNAQTKRSKYIDIRHHHLRDRVRRGEVKPQYTPTTKMLADILTKVVKRPAF